MKPILRVKFVDLCSRPEEAIEDCIKVLSHHYQVELSDSPEVVFYTGGGLDHRHYRALKFFYTGENLRPPMFACDFAMSHDYIDSIRHHRVPHYALYRYLHELENKEFSKIKAEIDQKTEFCSFVVSNAECQRRIDFFHKLSEYKQIASGGKVLNNVGGRVPDKHAFLKSSKFNICFENSSFPGYTTEKITDAMRALCIPIYWGSPRIGEEFNPKSFVNVHDYDSDNAAIDAVIRIDQDQQAYEAMMAEPWLHGNRWPRGLTHEGLADVLKAAIDRGPARHTFGERAQSTLYYAGRTLRQIARDLKRSLKK